MHRVNVVFGCAGSSTRSCPRQGSRRRIPADRQAGEGAKADPDDGRSGVLGRLHGTGRAGCRRLLRASKLKFEPYAAYGVDYFQIAEFRYAWSSDDVEASQISSLALVMVWVGR